jgi:NMD protein affecting ribosome stability and mRNA decay
MVTLKCNCGKKADVKIDRRLLCHDCYFKEKGVRNGQWSRNNIPRTTTYGPRK